MEKYFADTVVIGGGASGMLCAITAAQKNKNKNKRIILIDKEEKTGRKLLATGNGRCNLTNLNASEENYKGSFSAGVSLLLKEYPPAELLRRFANLGLICVAEADGRVYPVSKHSATVTEVLNLAAEHYGITVLNGFKAVELKKDKRKFTVLSENAMIIADNAVVCTGGKTYPKLGSDGSIFPQLERLGHRITALSPALCPLASDDADLKYLKGVRCQGKAALYDGDKFIREEAGEIQFTEKAISGICVFNLSRFVKAAKKPVIQISLLPDYSEKELYGILSLHKRIFSAAPADKLFSGIFRSNIGAVLVRRAGIKAQICAQISDKELHTLARLINCLRFSVKPPSDFDTAQITCGGVYGGEIIPETFESRKVKKLYFCGEVIDVDGECGGYNLHFAFASALKVGDLL